MFFQRKIFTATKERDSYEIMRKESLGKSLDPLCPQKVCDASVICAIRHIGSEFEDLEPSTPGARVRPGNGFDGAKRNSTLDHKFEFR